MNSLYSSGGRTCLTVKCSQSGESPPSDSRSFKAQWCELRRCLLRSEFIESDTAVLGTAKGGSTGSRAFGWDDGGWSGLTSSDNATPESFVSKADTGGAVFFSRVRRDLRGARSEVGSKIMAFESWPGREFPWSMTDFARVLRDRRGGIGKVWSNFPTESLIVTLKGIRGVVPLARSSVGSRCSMGTWFFDINMSSGLFQSFLGGCDFSSGDISALKYGKCCDIASSCSEFHWGWTTGSSFLPYKVRSMLFQMINKTVFRTLISETFPPGSVQREYQQARPRVHWGDSELRSRVHSKVPFFKSQGRMEG